MEQIAKMFLGIILIIIITFTSIGLITATIDASHAEDYAAKTASIIEAGNFSDNVISNCQAEAIASGYNELIVKKIDSNNDGRTDMAEIVLKYNYTIPILNITGKEHTAKSYAR